jgi:hypothetical protein
MSYSSGSPGIRHTPSDSNSEMALLGLNSARWIPFADNIDPRGRLTAVEGSGHVPFEIQRVFYVHQVTPGLERGGHSHPETDQVAVAIHGSLKIDLCDGSETRTFELSDPSRGLYLPRRLWCRLYDFSSDVICLVFASTHYDRAAVIRTWDRYLASIA